MKILGFLVILGGLVGAYFLKEVSYFWASVVVVAALLGGGFMMKE